jgi:hypothetical protein
MIDWWDVLTNAVWISGAALALAVVSYACWAAPQQQQKLRTVLGSTAYQLALYGAGWLFCLGLAATSTGWLEIFIWAGLSVICLAQLISHWRTLRRSKKHESNSDQSA